MADTITIKGMESRARRFLDVQTVEQLAKILGKDPMKLAVLAALPQYREFDIPKKNGGKRHIEDPAPPLKKVQRKLNDFLQAVYFFHRTDNAFGFITNPVDDPSPRHILTNAQAHLGCRWLLNVDMKDFFHLVSQERTEQLFEAPLFGFGEHVSTLLASLACYKGRLPMGAPTSPVISNLVSIPLDEDLNAFARERGWTYTRYADDMSFSSQTEIPPDAVQEIEAWVKAYDFELNPAKVKLFGPGSPNPKEVTGLHVGETEIGLGADYTGQLTGAIQHLNDIVDAQYLTPSGKSQPSRWVEELEAMVRGKLEFARQILGEADPLYQDLSLRLENALEPPETYGPLTWLEFGYATPR
ncbi:MAG: hypothetical protein KIPDCIKN_02456 [Haliscomenobacter sp.]|jgi:RNA-directed DNA polymerase|nr:hypothetical protein [Haliscomenobacter sp.]